MTKKDVFTRFGLDYVSLVKLVPIGIALNVFAHVFISIPAEISEIVYQIAFLLIFSYISYDSIVEFGRYDYTKLPLKFRFLSLINGIILLFLIISIAFFSNPAFKEYSIKLILTALALSSILEAIFVHFLGKSLKDEKIDSSQTDYDIKDTQYYKLWEIGFTFAYAFLIYFNYIHHEWSLGIIYIAFICLIAEIWLFNRKFKTPPTRVIE